MLRMMKYQQLLPSSDLSRRRERGFSLIEALAALALAGMIMVVSIPMMRRSMVRAEMMGQVKMLRQAIAVSRMTAIKEGQPVVLELLYRKETPPGGKVFSWVDNNGNRRYNKKTEELVGEWQLNTKTGIIRENKDRRMRDLRQNYKGIIFLPTGISIATKAAIPGIGRSSVIIHDRFENRIRLEVWSSTAMVDVMMYDPVEGEWSDELRFWRY